MTTHFVLTANPNAELKLQCGCVIPFWKVLMVTASQILAGVPIICPEHKVPHDFSNCEIFRDLSKKFYEKMTGDDDGEPIIFLP